MNARSYKNQNGYQSIQIETGEVFITAPYASDVDEPSAHVVPDGKRMKALEVFADCRNSLFALPVTQTGSNESGGYDLHFQKTGELSTEQVKALFALLA